MSLALEGGLPASLQPAARSEPAALPWLVGPRDEGRLAVSVVVPSFRRPALLLRCLRALLTQDFDPADYEIIVANDKPDSATRDAVARLRAEWSPETALHYLPVRGPGGPAAARNQGWRAASGRVIAFTDDDTIPSRAWLREGLQELGDERPAARGRVIVPLPPRPTDYERDAAGLETAEFVTANCFVRRGVLARLGGFDERFRSAWREDSDLHFRLLESGAQIADAPGAVVLHPVRPGRWGVSLQQQKKVFYDALLYKKHPQLYRAKLRAQPRWDYYAAVGLLLGGLLALLCAAPLAAAACCGAWLAWTLRFAWRRLRGTSHAPAHVAEMLLTSAAIPPLAVWWRLRGAWRFRVRFA